MRLIGIVQDLPAPFHRLWIDGTQFRPTVEEAAT